jgi:hypothetical protein
MLFDGGVDMKSEAEQLSWRAEIIGGARALARFNVRDEQPLGIMKPFSARMLKRRERRAPNVLSCLRWRAGGFLLAATINQQGNYDY